MPWHDQQMYLDGLLDEMQRQAEAAGGGQNGESRVDYDGGNTAEVFGSIGIPIQRAAD